MSQGKLTPSGRRGSDIVVVVSGSHIRMCGREAAAEHERQAAAAGFSNASGSMRRVSHVRSQEPQMPRLEEQTEGQDMTLDVTLSYEEISNSPIVHIIHHGNKAYLEKVAPNALPVGAGGTRPLTYQTPRAPSRSPSPLTRPASPMTRPPTPIARPSSPKFRAMSPLQAARLSSYKRTSPSHVTGAVRPSSALSMECRYSKMHNREDTKSPARLPPSSRHGSTNTMLKIVETCGRCTDIADAIDTEEHDDSVAVQKRTEVKDPVPKSPSPSRRGSSATAAIVAAAVSAAGFQLEANGTKLQPCLDCLEEYVRRERVEKHESAETSADAADSEESEVITATTKTADVSTTEIAVPKHRSPVYCGSGGSKATSAASSGSAKSSPRPDSVSISAQSPSPYRCCRCNACKTCGHIPPPAKK